jgi:small subunit ribosomal protein S18
MAAHGKDRSRAKPNDAKNRVRRGRPKVCVFCAQQIAWVDYKDTNLLRRFMTDRGKIKARATSGTCRQHQRALALAIKTARELAMLPYLVRTLSADKSGGRRGRDGGRPTDRPPTDAASAAQGGDGDDQTADGEALRAGEMAAASPGAGSVASR